MEGGSEGDAVDARVAILRSIDRRGRKDERRGKRPRRRAPAGAMRSKFVETVSDAAATIRAAAARALLVSAMPPPPPRSRRRKFRERVARAGGAGARAFAHGINDARAPRTRIKPRTERVVAGTCAPVVAAADDHAEGARGGVTRRANSHQAHQPASKSARAGHRDSGEREFRDWINSPRRARREAFRRTRLAPRHLRIEHSRSNPSSVHNHGVAHVRQRDGRVQGAIRRGCARVREIEHHPRRWAESEGERLHARHGYVSARFRARPPPE